MNPSLSDDSSDSRVIYCDSAAHRNQALNEFRGQKGRSAETCSVINGNSETHLVQSSSVDLWAEQGHAAGQVSDPLIMRRNEIQHEYKTKTSHWAHLEQLSVIDHSSLCVIPQIMCVITLVIRHIPFTCWTTKLLLLLKYIHYY